MEERAKGDDDAILRKNLVKNMSAIEKLYKEMEKLQIEAANKKGIWGKAKMSPELKQQRDEDLKLIHKHIQQVKKEHKRLLMGKSKSDDDKKPKKHRKVEFDSVENMKDMSKSEDNNLPKIDISAGLTQIEENKKLENQYLDKLLEQVGVMGDLANSFRDELELQCDMLDKLENDVNKHLETIGKVNKNLDKLIEYTGGTTKLMVIGCLIIIILALIAMGMLFIKVFVLAKA